VYTVCSLQKERAVRPDGKERTAGEGDLVG
jgi:hypothetical protein